MMRASLALGLACLVLAPLSGTSRAGCRQVVVQKFKAVGYSPFYGNYAYQVGAQVQLDSQQARDERIADLVVKKLQAAQLHAPQVLPQSMSPDRWSLVRANCAKCHTETNEKAIAALYMGDFDALDCDTKVLMAKRILDGEMPPNKPLAPDVIGNLLGQIVGAKTAPNYTPQVQAQQLEAQAESVPPPPNPEPNQESEVTQ